MRSNGSPGNDQTILVEMGGYRVANHSTRLTCVGLGSCVALVLHDPQKEIGGVAHIMLPSHSGDKNHTHPGKFADSSIEVMTKEMQRLGGSRRSLRARLFGGANMFPMVENRLLDSIGDRNVRAVKEELKRWRIKIVDEDVGGHVGRTIVFNPQDGGVRIRYAGGNEKVHV